MLKVVVVETLNDLATLIKFLVFFLALIFGVSGSLLVIKSNLFMIRSVKCMKIV